MGISGRVVAFISLVVLVACGVAEGTPTAPDVLFLQSSQGVTVVETGATAPTFKGSGAVPSGDWSTVVRSEVSGTTTRVVATDPSSGSDLWADVIVGKLDPKVVSPDGGLVALGPRGERYHGYGRAETKLVIAGQGLPEPRTITLDGNYEPEAFSTDGDSLFVISYLPARAPTRYQVRRLDLTTGRVHGVYTPDAELQQSMGGTARIQAASPDGTRLYTLYTVGGARGVPLHAFIHVLSLDEEWAHCIDLPDDFAIAAESATALVVSPDGKSLYVANTVSGAVAELDTQSFQVTRTTRSSFQRGDAHAAIGSDSTLYVASGHYVVAISGADFGDRWSSKLPQPIRGLQVTENGEKLYVGLRSRVASLDTNSGEMLDTLDPPGIKTIQKFGPVVGLEEEEILKCAC